MTDILKPCPFCGSEGQLLFSHEWSDGEVWTVFCYKCDIDRPGDTKRTTEAAKQSAITAWNTRHTQVAGE